MLHAAGTDTNPTRKQGLTITDFSVIIPSLGLRVGLVLQDFCDVP
jgi:hypothetical protein